MISFKNVILLAALFITANSGYSQDGVTIVAIGNPELKKIRLGVLRSGKGQTVKEISEVLESDFNYYKKTFLVNQVEAASITTSSACTVDALEGRPFDYIVSVIDGKGLDIRVCLIDLINKKVVIDKTKKIRNGERDTAHDMSDEIYGKITDKKSIFKTNIVFVSDKNSRKHRRVKELYIMDYDGKNKRQLTHHNEVVISPAISPDGNKVLYSVIKEQKKIKNVDLYIMDLKTQESKPLSTRDGINSGAIFAPNGRDILLTLTGGGNADIFEMNLATKNIKPITNHFADDVDPSLSANGYQMSFLSNRPGKAMIYTMDIRGVERDVKRISYVGKFNATPRFSPDGSEIVFASWSEEEQFDLYRISADGSSLVRLTKDFGSNEEPSYSNDGQFIAFSSLRVISKYSASQNIYIMDRDGEIIGPITTDYGNCTSPRWSN